MKIQQREHKSLPMRNITKFSVSFFLIELCLKYLDFLVIQNQYYFVIHTFTGKPYWDYKGY